MLKRFAKQVTLTSETLRHFTKKSETLLGIARVEISYSRKETKEEQPYVSDLKKRWGGEILLETPPKSLSPDEIEFHPRKDSRQWGGGILLY